MWAMAFVNTAAKSGHLSRDPFGVSRSTMPAMTIA
jgi:hypothetical protein